MERIIELNRRVDPLTNNYTNYYTLGHPHLEKSHNKSINEVFEDQGKIVDGVYRWNSNNRVPFQDMLADFVNNGLMTKEQFITTRIAQVKQEEETLVKFEKFLKDVYKVA